MNKTYINLQPEEKCSFFINATRKKLWNCELELLEQFDSICRKLDLKYFFVFGAALGVERHHGFIPWDDDIDIGMLRDDFEIFVNYAKTNLEAPCHFQYGVDDINDGSVFCRLRYDDTTAIIRSQYGQKCHHGIYIEIYPFDRVPNNKILQYVQLEFSSLFRQLIEYRILPRKKGKLFGVLNVLFKPMSAERLFATWDYICKFYNKRNCRSVNTVFMPHYAKSGICKFLYDDVVDTVYKPFENTEVQVAKENDKNLRIYYGDYMQFPPVEERGAKHSTIVFYDPDRRYSDYMGSDILPRFFEGDASLCPLFKE